MSPGGLSIVSVKLRHNNYVFDEKRWGPKNRPTLPRNSQANINQRSLIMYARSNHRSQWSLRPCLSCSGSMMWIAWTAICNKWLTSWTAARTSSADPSNQGQQRLRQRLPPVAASATTAGNFGAKARYCRSKGSLHFLNFKGNKDLKSSWSIKLQKIEIHCYIYRRHLLLFKSFIAITNLNQKGLTDWITFNCFQYRSGEIFLFLLLELLTN